jgi:superfamily II DNA or RNA helicase
MIKGSFEFIEKKIRNEFTSETDKGKKFSDLYKLFFENYPLYKRLFTKIWHWDDWPFKWGKDKGIDLIALTKNNEYWAIQAKGYQPHYKPTKHDIDKFLSESNRRLIKNRIFITTSSDLGSNAQEVIDGQEKPVQVILRDTLLTVKMEWPISVGANKKLKKIKYKLHPFQKPIVKNVLTKFKSINDGKLIMACGTGKTYVSLKIDEGLKNKKTLFLVPSLSLIQQQIKEWSEKSIKHFDSLIVCSRADVLGKRDEQNIPLNQIILPPTEDPKIIRKFLNKKTINRKVVFCTYHSLDKVIKSLKNNNLKFDFTIFDEAHHTAGAKNNFSLGLDRRKIKTRKRMFMTATPLIINERRVNYYRDNGFDVISMDQEAYGEILHKYDFSQAMKDKTLARYEVICVGTSEDNMKDLANKRTRFYSEKTGETDLRYLGSQVALINSIQKFNLKRIISFHSRITSASDFIDVKKKTSLQNALKLIKNKKKPKIILDHISSKISMGDRLRKLQNLKNIEENYPNYSGIITNCFCLGEGVDVPALNCVALLDPRSSPIDITQIVGRAIRKPINSKKDVGYVFIPIHLKNEDKENEVEKISGFQNIIKVVRALRAHDDDLSNAIDELTDIRIDNPSASKKVFDKKFKIHLPIGFTGKDFINNIRSRLIDITADSWEANYIKLKKYFLKYKNSDVPVDWPENPSLYGWCERQRSVYKVKKISNYRINKLKELNFRLETTPKPSWEKMFNLLLEYNKKFKTTIVPRRPSTGHLIPGTEKFYPENNSLDMWVKSQRSLFKTGKLLKSRKGKLDKINFIFDDIKSLFDREMLIELIRYNKKYKNFSPPLKGKTKKLKGWIGNLRARYKKNIDLIDKNVLKELQNINFPFDAAEEKWNESFKLLKDEWIKNNKTWPLRTHKLQRICIQVRQSINNGLKGISRQNKRYKKIKRKWVDYEKRKKQLEEIQFPLDVKEAFFLEILDLMKKYKKKFNNLNIGKSDDDIVFSEKLVNFVNNIKRTNNSYLTKDMKKRLKQIGFKI